jgi:hypothetical protein
MIIAAACGIRSLERYQVRQDQARQAGPERSPSSLRSFAISAASLAVGAVALAFGATQGTIVATGCGLFALAAVVGLRRLGVGPWGIAAIAVTAIGIALVLAAGRPELRAKSVSIAFAAGSPAWLISMSQRMLDDAPWSGTGAGSFAALAPIYRAIDDPATGLAAPTAAAGLAIELGWPMLCFITAALVGAIVVLLRASLQRGRDFFYPALGASCLITLLLLAFVNAGPLGTATTMIAAAVLGLALAQSKSRTVRP